MFTSCVVSLSFGKVSNFLGMHVVQIFALGLLRFLVAFHTVYFSGQIGEFLFFVGILAMHFVLGLDIPGNISSSSFNFMLNTLALGTQLILKNGVSIDFHFAFGNFTVSVIKEIFLHIEFFVEFNILLSSLSKEALLI